jgi:hypothetical protein
MVWSAIRLSESLIAKQNYIIWFLKNETDLKKKGKNVQNTAIRCT